MDERSRFDGFLAQRATPYLAQHGFRRSGQRYRAARGRNTVVIRFQRRRAFFTCDLAVASAVLIDEFGDAPPEHWAIRLGSAVLGYDKWWDLAGDSAATADDFLATLGRGVDLIEPIATDEGLRDAILGNVMRDGARGVPPIWEAWAITLIRHVGPGQWATR